MLEAQGWLTGRRDAGEIEGLCSSKSDLGKSHHLEGHHDRKNESMRIHIYSSCSDLEVTCVISTHSPWTRISCLLLLECMELGTRERVVDAQ